MSVKRIENDGKGEVRNMDGEYFSSDKYIDFKAVLDVVV